LSNYDPGFAQNFARNTARLLAGVTNFSGKQFKDTVEEK
jgi:hypothetical protein